MSEPDLAALFHELWEAIHVKRFDKAERGAGPDNFYNGVVTSRGEVMRVARKYGVTEQQVYRGK